MNERATITIRYRLAARFAAILSLIAIATGVLVNWRFPYLMDFLSYWAAGVIAVGGSAADAYDVTLHHAVQERAVVFDTRLPFAYPPPYLILLLPFGLLPYALAAATWIGLTLSGFAFAVRKLMPDFVAAALAFPPVAICGISGQNGFLTAALFFGGLAALPKRPLIAGLFFGCLVVKPQLGLLVPLAFIAAREWRAFTGATVAVILLVAASLIAFGSAPWQGFVTQSRLFAEIATDGLVGWEKMASLFASLRLAGVPETTGFALHGVSALAGAAVVWQVWRATTDPLARGAALAPASLLVSPYLYVYDQIILVISLYWLLQRGVSRTLLIALFLLPLATIGQFWTGALTVNPAPLLTLILLWLVWRQFTPDQAAFGAAWRTPSST